MIYINLKHKNFNTITPFNILDALKIVKCDKYRGVGGISAEHLSLLFSAVITHGYLLNMFMKTAIVPIIKNTSGDTSDRNNYGSIALTTAPSKIFEVCLSIILEDYFDTHDQQLIENIQQIFVYLLLKV